jgi:epoxide hydrolase-like predicted phosphatase
MFGLTNAPMRKAVIFDWGGVLMRTVDYEPRRRWDRRLGLPEGSVEGVVHGSDAWTQAERGEISPDDYWLAVRGQLHLSPTQLSDLRLDFYSGDRLDEALLSLITALRARGVLIGLLSNNSLELLDMLADIHLHSLFDAFVISARAGIMKPDPGAYRAILEQLGVSAGQALFIDDSRVNIEGALAVGMTAIRFEPTLDLGAIIDNWLEGNSLPSAKDFAT